ncbi:MAG: diacylglycerol kinase family protein [Deltaproteobacteria bacterium]|nr:diacylglycerol kinase family protein [Deltaproteobacteria bacterium]
MNVGLVYHPAAGGGVSPEELTLTLSRQGYNVVVTMDHVEDASRLHQHNVQLMVVAGGDGTISRAALALQNTDLPLGILPMGTANNIATTLGISSDPEELMQRWRAAELLKLDVGLFKQGSSSRFFVEGTGGGLLPAGIAAMDAEPRDETHDPADSIRRAIRTYRRVFASLGARPIHLTLDGEDSEESLLLLEILNIKSVGSQVVLSLHTEPDDGFLSVVTAGEAQRHEIDTYLERRLNGIVGHLPLPVRRARHVKVRGWDAMHVDDEVRGTNADEEIEIQVVEGAVNVLV